jgi:CobQ-like glutamine amidotransferase family enzyme
MIRLAGLFPENLNLNGDFGNLEVLSRQFEWRGMACEVVDATTVDDLDDSINFVLIGHGSVAAWAAISQAFSSLTPRLSQMMANGVPLLAISTGFDMAISSGLIPTLEVSDLADRVSKFEIVKVNELEVLGYVNTNRSLPALYVDGAFIGSTLHGPLLAKNPELLEGVLAKIAESSGTPLAPIQSKEKDSILAALVSEVWKLESELANE